MFNRTDWKAEYERVFEKFVAANAKANDLQKAQEPLVRWRVSTMMGAFLIQAHYWTPAYSYNSSIEYTVPGSGFQFFVRDGTGKDKVVAWVNSATSIIEERPSDQ